MVDMIGIDNTERKRAYHKQRTQTAREEWQQLGVVPLSVNVPAAQLDYFKAITQMAVCVAAMKQIDSHDDTAITTLSNRRPKYVITLEDVDTIREAHENLALDCDKLETLLRAARLSKSRGIEEMGHGNVGLYYLAREYVIANFIRARYLMLKYKITNGTTDVPDMTLELDGRPPNVL